MHNYKKLGIHLLQKGRKVEDRTGVGVRRIFDYTMEWDLQDRFPAVTLKTLAWKAVVGELLWFLEGSINVERLREITYGVGSPRKTIWDDNYENQAKNMGYQNGCLGPVYGAQWRNFNGQDIDQIVDLISGIKNDPYGRRHIVMAWNPAQLHWMALPPCHYGFQCFVEDGKLSLKWMQRSVDYFLGLPFNIASYALLTHILAKLCDLEPGRLIFNGGDVHLYENAVPQCLEMVTRQPKEERVKLIMPEKVLLEGMDVQDFKLENYHPHSTITAKMAV